MLLGGSVIGLRVPGITTSLTHSSAATIVGQIITFPYEYFRSIIHLPWRDSFSFPHSDQSRIWIKRAMGGGIFFFLLLIIILLLKKQPLIFTYVLDTYIWLPLVELLRTIPLDVIVEIAVLSLMGLAITNTARYTSNTDIPSLSDKTKETRTVDDSIMVIIICGLVYVYLLGIKIKYFFTGTLGDTLNNVCKVGSARFDGTYYRLSFQSLHRMMCMVLQSTSDI
ncbi:MAG: hypothetical protein NZL83_03840 [Candidatus Absconditabacterales bacterium]|nr:hypothetical protein [Candidatus Absconditabacterales bacterium]